MLKSKYKRGASKQLYNIKNRKELKINSKEEFLL